MPQAAQRRQGASLAMAQDKSTKVAVYQEIDQEWLTLDSVFTFRCHPGVACFNICCRTATIMLSPYEVLRLSRTLGLTTRQFLSRYARREVEGQSNLPLAFIDLSRTPGSGCPFVGERGCQVYAQRPAACRLFPLTMGSRLTPSGIEDFYFCRTLEFCRGFEGGEAWTVASWRDNQGFGEYDEARRQWLAILLKQGLQGPLPAEAGVFDLMCAFMYDLDTVRQLAGSPVFREIREMDDETLESLQRDDLALLNFSCGFLTDLLFAQGGLWELRERLAGWLAVRRHSA